MSGGEKGDLSVREIAGTDELMQVCKALSAPLRVQILRCILEHGSMNLNALAEALGVTNGAMTAHIKLLSAAGLVSIENRNGRHGVQKVCRVEETRLILDLLPDRALRNAYETEIPIGSYTDCQAYPTCGLATREHIIGQMDDPRYFDDPERYQAGILWMMEGTLSYRVPNYLRVDERLLEIQIIQELSSEAPGSCEDWPSDIHFAINDVELGFWTSPGDFGSKRGIYTPQWWYTGLNQYGLLKTLTVNGQGSFIDGQRISRATLADLNILPGMPLVYRLSVNRQDRSTGGMTLFGTGFGNYSQDIRVRLIYEKTRV